MQIVLVLFGLIYLAASEFIDELPVENGFGAEMQKIENTHLENDRLGFRRNRNYYKRMGGSAPSVDPRHYQAMKEFYNSGWTMETSEGNEIAQRNLARRKENAADRGFRYQVRYFPSLAFLILLSFVF